MKRIFDQQPPAVAEHGQWIGEEDAVDVAAERDPRQNAMNKTKKAMPSTVFRPGGTGCRGRNIR